MKIKLIGFNDGTRNAVSFGYGVFCREKVYLPTGNRCANDWEMYAQGVLFSPLNTLKAMEDAQQWLNLQDSIKPCPDCNVLPHKNPMQCEVEHRCKITPQLAREVIAICSNKACTNYFIPKNRFMNEGEWIG